MTQQQPNSRPPFGEYVIRVGGAVVVLCAAVLFTIVEAFLVPFKLGGVHVPVAALLAVLSNLALPAGMWWVTRVRGLALLPGAVWFLVTLMAAAPTASGDLVIPNMWPGLALLVAGAGTITCVGYAVIAGRWGRGPGS